MRHNLVAVCIAVAVGVVVVVCTEAVAGIEVVIGAGIEVEVEVEVGIVLEVGIVVGPDIVAEVYIALQGPGSQASCTGEEVGIVAVVLRAKWWEGVGGFRLRLP